MRQLLKQIKIPATAVALAFILAGIITSCHFFSHPMDMGMDEVSMGPMVHMEAKTVQQCCVVPTSGYQIFRNSVADIVSPRISLQQIVLFLLPTWLLLYGIRLLLGISTRQKLYDKAGRLLTLYNYLLELLSQGILSPKLYNA